MTTRTITEAQKQIGLVLRRYRLRWEDVAPDIDEQIWKQVRPAAKKIRRRLFAARYPDLRAETRR